MASRKPRAPSGMAARTKSLGGEADVGREAWLGALVGGIGGGLGGGFGTAAGFAGNAARNGSSAAKIAAGALRFGGPIVTGGASAATNSALKGGDLRSILTGAAIGAGIGLASATASGALNQRLARAQFVDNFRGTRFGGAVARAGLLPQATGAQANVNNPQGPFDQPLGYFYGSRIGAPGRIAVQSLNGLIWG